MVTGLTAAEIGELAADRLFILHELSPLRGSLEDAFMEMTHDAVEFRTDDPVTVVATAASPRSN